MAIHRNRKKQQYINIPADILRNPNLSLRDRGLLITALSLPENWEFSVAGLQKILPQDGKHVITGTINHLEQLGYLYRKQGKEEKGKFAHNEWDVYEEPCKMGPLSENPSTDNLIADKPSAENQPQSNINISIMNISNKNQSTDDQETAYQGYKDKLEYSFVAEKVQKIILDTVCAELFEREERNQVTKKQLLDICRKIEDYDKPINNLQAFTKKILDNYFSKKIVSYKSKVDEYNTFMKNDYDFDELEKMLLRN